jgi:hypothetical protein
MEPSESSTRELTLEEAISLAILLQKNEQFGEAQEVYRRVLETSTTLADLLTPLLAANPFSAMRASLRR